MAQKQAGFALSDTFACFFELLQRALGLNGFCFCFACEFLLQERQIFWVWIAVVHCLSLLELQGPRRRKAPLDDPMDGVISALALALDQAKRALGEVRKEPSPASTALAAKCVAHALEAKVTSLETQITALEDATKTHLQTVAEERPQRTAADTRCANLQSEVEEERVALEKGQLDLKVAQKEFETKMKKLQNDQALLKAAQAKLITDKRAAVTNLKRSVGEMEAELEEEERIQPPTKVARTTPKPSRVKGPLSNSDNGVPESPMRKAPLRIELPSLYSLSSWRHPSFGSLRFTKFAPDSQMMMDLVELIARTPRTIDGATGPRSQLRWRDNQLQSRLLEPTTAWSFQA
ncbi:hypothetical protein B0H16DRAFT_1452212 [Mycena metata]|uniref:Uncharacterized protein n=1 Tax=Mycena metata TaxID=1033252 RepID=A0AAD7JQN8_9AGAR|nr:hypothetical protein B0H16DRAFT_1452212 [Mycena metata]